MRILKTNDDLQSLYDALRKGKPVSKAIRAYKYVNAINGCGPYQPPSDKWRIERPSVEHFYEPGFEYEEKGRVNKSEHASCGGGIHVATLKWCRVDGGFSCNRYRLLLIEFASEDIIAIPTSCYSSYRNAPRYVRGKFRLRRMRVVAYAHWETGDRL